MHTVIADVFFVVPLKLFPIPLSHDVVSSGNDDAILGGDAYQSINGLSASVARYLYGFHTPINIRQSPL